MTIRFERYGDDYDASLVGANVLGCIGDFNVPFQAAGQNGVQARIKFAWMTNNVNVSQEIKVTNPKFHYRWRYLNQVVPEWQTLDFTPSAPSYLDDASATQLVTTVNHTLNQGVGDLEYFFTADLDAQYYSVRDYANDTAVGFGEGWTEKISVVTNRAVYSTSGRNVPTGGTDYFVRIREGESNMEWVKLVGELAIVTNAVTGACETNHVEESMSLVDHHLWRYHYLIPTNGVGARLTFRLEAKEYYTNDTDSATWHIRTNRLYAADEEIKSLPYTATLSTANTKEMSVVLDGDSSHLKIEYNDEQGAFAFSHASYQSFNLWTDAKKGFVGNSMITNGTDVVSDSGVSGKKTEYKAPFNSTWLLPTNRTLWTETFLDKYNGAKYKPDEWFSLGKTPDNGWTAHNARYVQNVRSNPANLALAIDGLGEGSLTTESFSASELPLGLESVSFTARIAQPVVYDDFATYLDGLSCQNYAISAKVTMSQEYEGSTYKPKDVSPVNPSVSLVAYHRGKRGCYEFRMTRHKDDKIKLEFYKWVRVGSQTTPVRLGTPVEFSSKLLPTTTDQRDGRQWTGVYFLVYTINSTKVRLEGHIASGPSTDPISTDIGNKNMQKSAIWYVDSDPGVLASGGSYGVGSTDCQAGFGEIRIHEIAPSPEPGETAEADAVINANGTLVGKTKLANEWDYYESRWMVDTSSKWYAANGCLLGVVPTNQAVQLWLSDAEAGSSTGWQYSGYETIINSFTTNSFKVSPKKPGSWRVRLQTRETEEAGVVLDDVSFTRWEGMNVWDRMDGSSDRVSNSDTNWAFTKGWISNKAGSTTVRECLLQPSRGKVGYPMGLRSPYIDEGLSLFSYSYKNADSNCVLLVQIATNMVPRDGTQYVAPTTEIAESDFDNGYIWTTVATNDFMKIMKEKGADELKKGGTLTTFISLRQHNVYDRYSRTTVLTNVCGLIRVIVDPAIVKKVVEAPDGERESLENYGQITLTEAHCYNEPALDLKSWFGWNVHTVGWDGSGNASPYAYLTDYPAGLSIALNFSAKNVDNTSAAAQGVGLAESDKIAEYAQQNPFVQCSEITNGIGTVSFRARLFDTNQPPTQTPAVITLYGGTDPGADQPTTDSATWDILTNFVVTSSTYQPFTWAYKNTESPYKAVRLSAAGARHGREPSISNPEVKAWEWANIEPKQSPINRVLIDEMSVSELIVPRLKFLDVRPFRTHLGTEDICVVEDITSESQQPLIAESWGIQCRVEPAQMADELDKDSIRVFMEVYRGERPWGYAQWASNAVDNVKRFRAELTRVPGTLIYRSYYTVPASIMKPESEPNTVYQYVVRAEYNSKADPRTTLHATLNGDDWTEPFWYRGSTVGAGNASGDSRQFSAYTILDAISPHRAWVNEINYVDGEDDCKTNQFIELAVPQTANIGSWKLRLTDRSMNVSTLAELGIDTGVSGLDGTCNISSVADVVSKRGGQQFGDDYTNHYTFVSVCAKSTWDFAKANGVSGYDGYWNTTLTNNTTEGRLRYYEPYGIQLIRPSGIIEHEFVVEGANPFSPDEPQYAVYGWKYSGTNLVAMLKEADSSSQWFYTGEDSKDANTSLGVFRGHGEDADPSNWTNWMYCTPSKINKLKDGTGTLQKIPDWFIEPNGTNVWIYAYLLDGNVRFFGGRDNERSSVFIIQKDYETNIVVTVTNWYQIGTCTTNGEQVVDACGKTGKYTVNLGKVQETMTVNIGTELQAALTNDVWGLTKENRYTPAVVKWLMEKYPGCGPEDLSKAELRTLSFKSTEPNPTWLSLTDMYWLDIPPVTDYSKPVYGGSNIWFVASLGTIGGGDPVIESRVTTQLDGTICSNVFLTMTMMITNTVTGEARPPDRLNGLEYDGVGSFAYNGRPAWTSVVFSVTGALQRDGERDAYYPLQQYVFTPDSFGDTSNPPDPSRRFETCIEVTDPYYKFRWSVYRGVYPIWYRWSIKDNPDGRVSISPLKPNWPSSTP